MLRLPASRTGAVLIPFLTPTVFYFSQAGGSMHVVLPTWTECTIHKGRTQISSTVLNGTTGKGQATHSRPQPWWSDPQTSKHLHAPGDTAHCRAPAGTGAHGPLGHLGHTLPERGDSCPQTSAPGTSSLNEPKQNSIRAMIWHCEEVGTSEKTSSTLRDWQLTDSAVTTRKLCVSLSVNNWKTEHLCYTVQIILELYSCKHCL